MCFGIPDGRRDKSGGVFLTLFLQVKVVLTNITTDKIRYSEKIIEFRLRLVLLSVRVYLVF
jgi:hypothetical protein